MARIGMNEGQSGHFIGTGADANPNDCSVVTADGKIIQMAGQNTAGTGEHGPGTEDTKRDEARARIVAAKKEDEINSRPLKLEGWDRMIAHMAPVVTSEAHFIVVPDQEKDAIWYFPESGTYFVAPSVWKDLCEYGMNWWAERSEEMAYINEDRPSPYDDAALEPLLAMVRPKVVEK